MKNKHILLTDTVNNNSIEIPWGRVSVEDNVTIIYEGTSNFIRAVVPNSVLILVCDTPDSEDQKLS